MRIRWRLSLAILLAASVPVLGAVVLARSLVQQTSERSFLPEIGQHLERSLTAYQELARLTKLNLRLRAEGWSHEPSLVAAGRREDRVGLQQELARLIQSEATAVELKIVAGEDGVLAVAQGSADPSQGHHLRVARPLPGTEPELRLEAHFAAPEQQFRDFEALGEFIRAYSALQDTRSQDERTYVMAFAALMGLTIGIAWLLGTALSRDVVRQVGALVGATRRVAKGDLEVEVPSTTGDELGELSRAFNTMVQEVETSRGRIEYLSRLAAWQEMARRLAHEIKNPLTPIQLAAQEVHQRLHSKVSTGDAKLLDTMLDVVQTEVTTLRHLVTEFSSFARLPKCRLEDVEIGGFLEALREQSEWLPELLAGEPSQVPGGLEIIVPSRPALVRMDPTMLRRALANLVQNALQACEDSARVTVSVRTWHEGVDLLVDDDGPGFSAEHVGQAAEPYFTTKEHGTGLGLAIVKKIALDHEGSLKLGRSPLGGAQVAIRLRSAADEEALS